MQPREPFSLFFVQEMLRNCNMIEERIDANKMNRDSYAKSPLFQDMLTMPMIRICEIAKLYKSDLAEIYPNYD